MPLIETTPDLKKALKGIESEKRVGFDLEADSMYHFSEKVCLLQVASKNTAFAIDTVKLRDLSVLKPLFIRKDVMKIFHGADYDVRSLFRDFGIEIKNLFDTELASRFLGIKETGLEAVLRNRFDLKLEKKYQKKDWSQRPLSADMLNYALNDVRHLVSLSEILEKELDDIGRLSWVEEECEILCRVRSSEDNGDPLFLKFKGAGKLKPETLAVLEALLRFRKEAAQKKDRPLFKIMGNNSILKLAETKPDSLKKIMNTDALSQRQLDIYGKDLVGVISKAVKIPENMLPVYPRKTAFYVSESAARRIEALKIWRDKKAVKLNIDPGLLLNKSLISTIGVQNPNDPAGLGAIKEMKNWQRREFGDEIIRALRRKK
ncbi:MAG: HRDC domain-containing protein [Proteobacteria bacterium]|nr:HRDC domain-containing protein [Pseudomonadota bacterium]MBU1570889.1 HRDC domain-containing protein [Pseudomonadota bacterium]